ncbi:TPA: flagellar biosynthesis protein FliQ [Candidatus Poribacteria bacterium]|jgi:flagellar biosynthetic protein FliQ|nr:flagellar biosynthesis protein FliQ [Candidatus Poribacteria bacterium]HIM09759.1 flagellar biosynthesis protein FliQ [Candidatus Poribacteria bacterium]
MTPETIVGVGKEALFVAIQIAGPILLIGLVLGLIISIFQAVTQIQEMTLTFVPKLAALVIIVLLAGKSIAALMMNYTTRVIQTLPEMIG